MTDFSDWRDVDFPDWALCHLVNGDPLESADDITDYGKWEQEMREAGYSILAHQVLDDHNEFCSQPEFGLAGATTKVRFFKEKEE